jgi:hypothetical protein
MRSDWLRRADLVCAVAILLLAIGVFFAAPGATFRAKTSVTVPPPLAIGVVVQDIRTAGAVHAGARGHAVEVESTDTNRATARRRVASAVALGVDKAARDVATEAMLRAAAARSREVHAKADAAALAATSGLADPERAYQRRRAELDALQQQRDAARARGRAAADLDAKIASAQQDVFDLQFQAKRRAELAQEQHRAAQEAIAASATADRARVVAASINGELRVAAGRTDGWRYAALVIALVAATIAAGALLPRRRSRLRDPVPAPEAEPQPVSSGPEPSMTADDAILVEQALIRARARRAAAQHLDLVAHEREAPDERQTHEAPETPETRETHAEGPVGDG